MIYKYFRRLKKRILRKLFGRCYLLGHSWKMVKGWRSNPDFDIDNPPDPRNCFRGMTKEWIHYKCRHCPAIAEREGKYEN